MNPKQTLDERFRDKKILIIGDHPNAGTECVFVEMIPAPDTASGFKMRVVDRENHEHLLAPKNVFVIEKK